MAKMKVACCWDDGVLTDARLIEILRKYNAKATFNLNVGLMDETKPGQMRWNHDPFYPKWTYHGLISGKFARNQIKEIYTGFKVASHCWKHEHAAYCSTEEFTKAAVDCKKYLEDLFQTECPGFAWPCGAFTPETCASLRAAGFKYGRTVRNTTDVTKCADTMLLDSNAHFMDEEFYRKYEKAKETGVFYFWGHTYETMDFEPLWEQVEDKIRFITEDPDSEWVDVIDLVPLCHK